jgi:class 3 adenylate cyclase
MKGNERAFGYDLGSNQLRLQAIRKAKQKNQLAATGRIRLVQENAVDNGILVIYPFHKDGKVIGYVSGAFRIHDLISKAISHLPSHFFNITAYDLSAEKGNQFLASLSAEDQTQLNQEHDFTIPHGIHHKQAIKIADRDMMILITPSNAFLGLRTNISLLILILSVAISIGLCFHLIRYLKSENLLLNILPAPVALELKEKGRYEPRIFEKATILFCDFKDFTKIASQCNAKELVEEINYCFGEFDSIIEAFGIEKIKTVGDAYIAVGGLTDQGVQAAKKTVLAAIEMQKSLTARKSKNKKENRLFFEMRVGIHTGPIVAGIVGYTKFQYDIWGDTVNTASRLENLCEQGKVNISKATYELIHNDDAFSFEKREKQSVKGKGKLEMYYASEKGSIPFHRGQKIRKVIASQLFGSSEQLQA